MNEISRTKKELAFANKKLYHKKVQAEGAGGQTNQNMNLAQNFSNELENSIKLVETINAQKRLLETENDELKQRMNEMMVERTSNMNSALD